MPDEASIPTDVFPSSNDIVWRPNEEYLSKSRLRALMKRMGNESIEEHCAWAAEDIGRYWGEVVSDLKIDWTTPPERVVDLSGGSPWPDWFPGAAINYVANAIDRQAASSRRNQLAIIWEGDDGEVRKLSYRDLFIETNRLANALTSMGVVKGDRIGIFMPMVPETVVATLACGKIGAVYTPMFSGYGEEAVASRLRDSGATVLITADAFPRRGKLVPMKAVADAAMAAAPSVRTCIVLQRSHCDVEWTDGRDVWWHEAIQDQPREFKTVATAASDPYMIIYTSGTTGKPKGAVHVHGGFPIKATHDLAYCFDLHDDDVLFWLTDLGWMMGPWLIAGGLMLNSTLMIYEGTPDFPNPDRLWRLVEDHGVSILGLAPTAIRALMAKGDEWLSGRDFSTLRVLGSTGETWNPGPWRWYFDKIGEARCPIINYSGGTETGGGIVTCYTIAPQKPCAFSGPVPGMNADVVDDIGQPIRGAVGELVVRQPWVGMTHGFWNDPDRYVDTYWSRFPETWVHGDWAEIDEDGFWFIRGRSDDTLKVAGKRIGPAEIESAAVAHSAVQEAAAIGVPHELKGEAIYVFAVLRPGHEADVALADAVRLTIARQLGSSLRPEAVYFVGELPKTRNAKIMRRVIRATYLGLPAGDLTALENPRAVEEIVLVRQHSVTTP